MNEDTQKLLDRAAMAQLHMFKQAWGDYGPPFHTWMKDRQQLTNLIAELANKVKELSS